MVTRAKFEVDKVINYKGTYKEISLRAVCDDGLAKENKSFAEAMPYYIPPQLPWQSYVWTFGPVSTAGNAGTGTFTITS
jgi:hypothetical protein